MTRRLQIDHLVITGADRQGLDPARLQAALARELVRAGVGPVVTTPSGEPGRAAGDVQGLAREIARAVLSASRGGRG